MGRSRGVDEPGGTSREDLTGFVGRQVGVTRGQVCGGGLELAVRGGMQIPLVGWTNYNVCFIHQASAVWRAVVPGS